MQHQGFRRTSLLAVATAALAAAPYSAIADDPVEPKGCATTGQVTEVVAGQEMKAPPDATDRGAREAPVSEDASVESDSEHAGDSRSVNGDASAPAASAAESSPERAGDESPASAEAPSLNGDAPVPNMVADDYRLYRRYQAALRDPRVRAMGESQRMPAIARNFGVELQRLREVASLGDEYGEGQLERQEAAAKAALEASVLEGRIRSIQFIERRGIVVAYVGWRTTEADRVVPEAVHLAKIVSDAAPVTELVAMWACMGNRKVFTARVQSSSATHISSERIECFAETRYIRLFEEVRNMFGGEPPDDDVGCP